MNMQRIKQIQADLDGTLARLDSHTDTGKSGYEARMERIANAWKEQEQATPVDRMADVIQGNVDQLQNDLRAAHDGGETGDGYLSMLEASADSIAESVDTYIATKKGRSTGTEARDAAHDARMGRLSSAWKDDDEKASAEEKAASRKRAKEDQDAREAKPIFSGDAQAALDAAYRARQERTANAWKDGSETAQAGTVQDLAFGIR